MRWYVGVKFDKIYSTEQMQSGSFKKKFNHNYHCQYGRPQGYKNHAKHLSPLFTDNFNGVS